jgi:DNA-directed RNA polymerase specialized sigma subunit
MSDLLEPEYRDVYGAWKAGATPETTGAMLTALQPAIEGAARLHAGDANPLMLGRGRRLALQSLGSYDPTRGRLQTHLYNSLQGLKRYARQQTQPLHVPERVAQTRAALEQHRIELEHELGRDPSDAELADRTGLALSQLGKIRRYHPGAAEGAFQTAEGGSVESAPLVRDGREEQRRLWHALVYDDLPATDQLIMEHTLGINGKDILSNQELARRLRRTPGAISQRKARIQQMLDEADALGDR